MVGAGRRGARLRRASLVLATAALASPAWADGRFPESVSVTFRPGSPRDIYLGTTFGLLVSHDDGESFYWLCEQSIGFDDGAYDPHYRVASDGTLYANTFSGLRVSRDGGCTFETATTGARKNDPGRIAGKWIDAFDVGPDDAVWVGTTDAGRSNEVYRSTDGARTFRPLGLRSTVAWWKSLVVAPTRGERAYVSSYQVPKVAPDGGVVEAPVHLYRTDDAGQTWQALPVDGLRLGLNPLVLFEEVAADDPSLVFARSVRASAPNGDALYRSSNAGLDWVEVLATDEEIREVVARPDGTVWVATAGGIYRSLDRGATFVAVPSPQARCLADRGDALFACGTNWDPDRFALGRSIDGAAWSKVHRFVEMKAPLSCPAGSVQHDTCEVVRWPIIRDTFGLPASPPVVVPPLAPESGGCGCGLGEGGAAVVAAVAFAGFLLRGRRRRCCG